MSCPLTSNVPHECDLIEFENAVLKAFEVAASDGTASEKDHRLIETMNRLIQLARDVDDCDGDEDEPVQSGSPSELLKLAFE